MDPKQNYLVEIGVFLEVASIELLFDIFVSLRVADFLYELELIFMKHANLSFSSTTVSTVLMKNSLHTKDGINVISYPKHKWN